MQYKKTWIIMEQLLLWRQRHCSERNFVLLIALVVGVFTALAGLLLKWFIAQIEHALTGHFNVGGANVLYLIYPVVGIWLTMVFIRYVVRDDIGHGVTKILFAIARKQSYIRAHNTWTSVVASGLTIGFGGSVGAEAPIVLTGSAIGSTLGRLFRLHGRTLMLLVGCGAAGAVSGIFKAPIAGLVFVLEVLMIDLTMGSLLPLLVSCVTAAGVTFAIDGMDTLFSFQMESSFTVSRTPAYILLGAACGLVALYFTRTMNMLENGFRRLTSRYARLAVVGAMLSILIFFLPSLFGEGYNLINLLLNGSSPEDWDEVMRRSMFYGHSDLLLVYLALVLVFKVFASTATNGGGGCGGIFAPSLFLGCISGFIFARLWNDAGLLSLTLSERNFAMLGMCGLMSGVMHAPLTGIFLIAELTGGYAMFMPLMMVSVCAYLTIKVFEPHSIYAMRLARRGELMTHNKDRSILTLMSLDSCMERYEEASLLRPEMDLADVARRVAASTYNVFPVVNMEGKLRGVLYVDDVRHIIMRSELYHRILVSEVMKEPPARLTPADSMDAVVSIFERTAAWTLPVVDVEGVFRGFVRKSRIFTTYRQLLADLSED